MIDSGILSFLLEHWQIVFIYGLYELKKIRQSMNDHNARLLYLELKDKIEADLEKKK